MKKHIVNFLILFSCFLALQIFYEKESRNNKKYKEYLRYLESLHEKYVRIETSLSDFDKLFHGKKLISVSVFKSILKKISLENDVKFKIEKINENVVRYNFLAKRASDIISTVECVSGNELNLCILISKISINKNSDDEYSSEVEFIVPFLKGIKFREIKKFQNISEEKLQQIISLYKNKFGISMFNQSCIFEGIVNNNVVINGEWIPKRYEDDNFISTMIDNCTIMLTVKKLNKVFRLEQNKKENIYK